MKNNPNEKEYVTRARDGFWLLMEHAFGKHAGLVVRVAICAALAAAIAPFFITHQIDAPQPEPNAQEQSAP